MRTLALRRRLYRRRLRDRPAARWLDEPLPRRRTQLARTPLLAVDVETTGLDPRRHELLSIGWVAIRNLAIELDSAQHHLVAGGDVGDSATIHGIRDAERSSAAPLREVLERFLQASAGCVLICHHAPLDKAFLDRALRRAARLRWAGSAVDDHSTGAAARAACRSISAKRTPKR